MLNAFAGFTKCVKLNVGKGYCVSLLIRTVPREVIRVRARERAVFLPTHQYYLSLMEQLHVKLQALNFVQTIHSFFRYMYSFISDMITF